MAPTAVRMVLVEGENGDGATVETENFEVPAVPAAEGDDAPRQVVSAILGTSQGAAESGCELASIGVTWTDPTEAAALRDLLAGQKIEKVMLVSAFLAAAALAQTVGNETRYAHTALLFVEPYSATVALIDSADGSVSAVRRQPLPENEEDALGSLSEMVAGVAEMEPRPDGLFVVGSDGVDVTALKTQLQAATPLVVSTPEEPEIALARGAALASANPPLFSSSTAAIAYAQDPGTEALNGPAAPLGYVEVPANVEHGGAALAYSAVADERAGVAPAGAVDSAAYTAVAGAADMQDMPAGAYAEPVEQRTTRPFLVAVSVLALFVGGVVALLIALAIAIRPHADTRPHIGARVVAPAKPVPPPAPQAPAPAAPAPAPAAPAPAAPAHAAPPPPPPALPLPRLPAPAAPPGPPGPPPGLRPPVPGGPHGPGIPGPHPPIPGGPGPIKVPHIPLPGIPGL